MTSPPPFRSALSVSLVALLAMPAFDAHAQHQHHKATASAGAQHEHHAPAPTTSAQQPVTPIPVLTDADREAARAPSRAHPAHDNAVQSYVLFNRLEAFDADHGAGQAWEGQGWIGTDTNKLWFRTEGEREDGRTHQADLEVMYGRPIAPWWDLVAGVRHDFQPGPSRDWAAIGVIGTAPYKFEVEATAYIGSNGRTAARVEADYDVLLTNRWILQPLIEAEFNGKDDAQRGVASGLSTVEAGLRLRYEITRKFAPYVGVVHERAYGGTSDFREAEGLEASDTRVVAGIRVWF
jgi:copper resistance protein B